MSKRAKVCWSLLPFLGFIIGAVGNIAICPPKPVRNKALLPPGEYVFHLDKKNLTVLFYKIDDPPLSRNKYVIPPESIRWVRVNRDDKRCMTFRVNIKGEATLFTPWHQPKVMPDPVLVNMKPRLFFLPHPPPSMKQKRNRSKIRSGQPARRDFLV